VACSSQEKWGAKGENVGEEKDSTKQKFPAEKRGEKKRTALDIRFCANSLDFLVLS
jgi:hypothetical protein